MDTIQQIEKLLRKKETVLENVEVERDKFDDMQKILSRDGQIYSEVARNVSGKELAQTLFLCDPVNSSDIILALTKRISENGILPIIILTTMNYKSAQKMLHKAGLDGKFFLIDTVSKNISSVEDSENVLFVDSLRNLTQLQIKIVKLIQSKKDIAFIFDALNVLELYHSGPVLLKFTYSVSKLLKKHKLSGYYSITKASLAPKLSQFFDSFAEIKKIE